MFKRAQYIIDRWMRQHELRWP